MKREEAIERIKTRFDKWALDDEDMKAIQTLIPDLQESEDERIRKALVWHLKADADFVSNGVTKAECIAYLEKQKELKPSWIKIDNSRENVVFPFNARVKDSDKVVTIIDGQLNFNGKQWIRFSSNRDDGFKVYCPEDLLVEQKPAEWNEDERIRKWLIDYFDKVNDEVVKEDRLKIIAYLEKQKEQKPVDYDHEMWKNCEANFEGGKKEVIEHPEKYGLCKSAEWSEEDERMLSRCIKSIECSKMFAETDTFKEAKDKEIDWLTKRLKPLCSQQKQEWSEEDEKMLWGFTAWIPEEELAKHNITRNGILEKLKSLRPQSKQEWSEEDEKYFKACVMAMRTYEGNDTPISKWIEALKDRVCPQPHWKPSEEQMKAMEEVRTIFHNHHLWDEITPILYDYEELMRDLKKLM